MRKIFIAFLVVLALGLGVFYGSTYWRAKTPTLSPEEVRASETVKQFSSQEILAQIEAFTQKNEELTPNPQVTVMMATYNRKELIPRAVESVLSQTFNDFELLIVDDASHPDTHALLLEYLKKDPRVRVYVNKENKRLSYVRNRQLSLARAPYLAILDSDDAMLPQRLQKQVVFLNSNPEITVVTSFVLDMRTGRDVSQFWWSGKSEGISYNMLFFNPINNSAVMFLKNFVDEHGLVFDETNIGAEDYDFWGQILLKGGKFGIIQEPLIKCRIHTTNSNTYYDSQQKNADLVSKKLQSVFYEVTAETEKAPRWQKILWVLEGNKKVQFFEEQTIYKALKTEYVAYCTDVLKLQEKLKSTKSYDEAFFKAETQKRCTFSCAKLNELAQNKEALNHLTLEELQIAGAQVCGF